MSGRTPPSVVQLYVPAEWPARCPMTGWRCAAVTMTNLSISTRLWLAISIISLAVAGLLVASGVHTLQLDREAAGHQARQDQVLALSLRWAGQTEVNVQRVIATVVSKDPAVGEHFKADVKSTTARINELQKELEGLADSAEEKAQLDQVAHR